MYIVYFILKSSEEVAKTSQKGTNNTFLLDMRCHFPVL